MANGARTVLVSRWRTGGQTSFDLVREFLQELPNSSASDAWQRAVQLTMDANVNLSAEPRINERIRVPEVRLVGPNGEQVGIVRVEDALRLAAESDLDLVEVAPMAKPP